MDDFPLIKSLQHPEEKPTDLVPQGRKYVEVEVVVEGHSDTILIPERERDNIINETLADLSQHEFKLLLRKYRGIRG
jgi:hypothetical protein